MIPLSASYRYLLPVRIRKEQDLVLYPWLYLGIVRIIKQLQICGVSCYSISRVVVTLLVTVMALQLSAYWLRSRGDSCLQYPILGLPGASLEPVYP
jgi:hypothetical protein